MAPPKQSLKDLAESKLAKGNPTQLGDPVSLKAETADSSPTDQDRGAASNPTSSSGQPGVGAGKSSMSNDQPKKSEDKSLKELAESKLEKGNKTMLGDPVSLKAETSDTEPTEDDRGAMSVEERKKRGSKI